MAPVSAASWSPAGVAAAVGPLRPVVACSARHRRIEAPPVAGASCDPSAAAGCPRRWKPERRDRPPLVWDSPAAVAERAEGGRAALAAMRQAMERLPRPRSRPDPPAPCVAARQLLRRACELLDHGLAGPALDRMRSAAAELKPQLAAASKAAMGGGSR